MSAMSATAATTISPERAARQILTACRQGAARVSPGWPARAAELTDALAPHLFSAALAAMNRTVLPRPSVDPAADHAVRSRALDLGWIEALGSGASYRS
jgi:hypothetical protein